VYVETIIFLMKFICISSLSYAGCLLLFSILCSYLLSQIDTKICGYHANRLLSGEHYMFTVCTKSVTWSKFNLHMVLIGCLPIKDDKIDAKVVHGQLFYDFV
jgi:hypothetical protein